MKRKNIQMFCGWKRDASFCKNWFCFDKFESNGKFETKIAHRYFSNLLGRNKSRKSNSGFEIVNEPSLKEINPNLWVNRREKKTDRERKFTSSNRRRSRSYIRSCKDLSQEEDSLMKEDFRFQEENFIKIIEVKTFVLLKQLVRICRDSKVDNPAPSCGHLNGRSFTDR